jgi:hypothetical protein
MLRKLSIQFTTQHYLDTYEQMLMKYPIQRERGEFFLVVKLHKLEAEL